MKINHLTDHINTSHWGGVEQTVLEYTTTLRKKGHISTISCRVISEEDKPIHRKFGLDIFLMSVFPPHLKDYNFDILHWHSMYMYLWWITPYLKKKKIPIIMSLHHCLHDYMIDLIFNGLSSRFGLMHKSKPFWLIRKLFRVWRARYLKNTLLQIKAFICHSHEHFKIIRECFPNHRVVYLPHGVDIKRFSKGDGAVFRKKYGIPENAFMVLMVARFDPEKKQYLLIELLPEMLKIRPDTHLVFVGAICYSKYHAELEKKIAELKVENFVTIISGLIPKSQDLVDAYHACDLFMLPRPNEVFGIVFVEAFCAGKCVIGSRSGGVPSVVTDGVTGLLHEPDNKPDILSCFKKVALDADYRNKLGSAAREEAYKKFNWDVIGDQLIELYESVLKDN